jgi:hypothetical protein
MTERGRQSWRIADAAEKPDACWNCGAEDAYVYLDNGMWECERSGDMHTRL